LTIPASVSRDLGRHDLAAVKLHTYFSHPIHCDDESEQGSAL
jgi:hypothetical protein